MKIRYEVDTGKVNLLTTGVEELEAPGCEYITVAEAPQWNYATEHLYVRDGKVVAIPAPPDE